MTRHVLLVGGDAGVTGLYRDFLHAIQRDEHDYEVESAEYCDDALALLHRRQFDAVVLLSLRAPWRAWPSPDSLARLTCETGVLFLSKLRVLHGDVPVIVVSGASWAKDTALAGGAFAFIEAPPNLDELDRTVTHALSASRDGA